MTKKTYDKETASEIVEEKDGSITRINHCHMEKIDFPEYNYQAREQLKRDISDQIVVVRGCHAFFKSLASNPDVKPVIKALAEGAAVEDETQLIELEKKRTSKTCCVL